MIKFLAWKRLREAKQRSWVSKHSLLAKNVSEAIDQSDMSQATLALNVPRTVLNSGMEKIGKDTKNINVDHCEKLAGKLNHLRDRCRINARTVSAFLNQLELSMKIIAMRQVYSEVGYAQTATM